MLDVLILLLMEYGHRDGALLSHWKEYAFVLILLLMEYGHRGFSEKLGHRLLFCLNPSFNGIWPSSYEHLTRKDV